MRLVFSTVVGVAALMASATGFAYDESGDAGSTPGTAQAVTGGATVINGSLGSSGDVDIYRLDFATSTSVTFHAGSSPDIDDNLILMDGAGHPLWGDDDSGGGPDGYDSQIVWNVTPGTYYLAMGDNNISSYNAADVDVCNNDDGDCSGSSEVVAYVAGGGSTGGYTITLSAPTAAAAAPQTVPTLSEWSMILLSGILAIAGLFVLRENRSRA